MTNIKNTEIEVKKRHDGKYNVWALLPDPEYKEQKKWVVIAVEDRPVARFQGNGNKITFI